MAKRTYKVERVEYKSGVVCEREADGHVWILREGIVMGLSPEQFNSLACFCKRQRKD